MPCLLLNLKYGKQGFASIVEVVMTSIVFIVATAGILSTVSMLQPLSAESSQKIQAAYLAKGLMDEFRKSVLAAPGSYWESDLDPGVHNLGAIGDYTVSYTVTDNDPIPNVRKVTMTVTW